MPIPLEQAKEVARIRKSAKSLLAMLKKRILALGGQIWGLIVWRWVQNYPGVLSGGNVEANAQSSEEKWKESLCRKPQVLSTRSKARWEQLQSSSKLPLWFFTHFCQKMSSCPTTCRPIIIFFVNHHVSHNVGHNVGHLVGHLVYLHVGHHVQLYIGQSFFFFLSATMSTTLSATMCNNMSANFCLFICRPPCWPPYRPPCPPPCRPPCASMSAVM